MSSFPGCRCSALLGAVAPLNTAVRYRLRQQLVCSEYFRAPPAGPWFVRPTQQPLRGSALGSADAVGGASGRRRVRGDGAAEGQPVRHGLGPAGDGAGHRGGPMGALGGRALAGTALCEPMYFLHQRRLRAPAVFRASEEPGLMCGGANNRRALSPAHLVDGHGTGARGRGQTRPRAARQGAHTSASPASPASPPFQADNRALSRGGQEGSRRGLGEAQQPFRPLLSSAEKVPESPHRWTCGAIARCVGPHPRLVAAL